MINDEWTIINIGETSYSRSNKMDYSCLPRGFTNAIVNTHRRGSTVMIFALISSEEWNAFPECKTINSWNFIKFIFILSKYWEMWLNFKKNDVIKTLDNPVIHRFSTKKVSSKNFEDLITFPSTILTQSCSNKMDIWYEQKYYSHKLAKLWV